MTKNDEESRPLRVRVIDGPLEGTTVRVQGRLTIGRASGSDIQLVHDGISRQHAQIVTDEHGRHVLVDLDSSNGTFVEGQRIRRQVLSPGTMFKIMRIKLIYEHDDDLPMSEESGVFAIPRPVDRRVFQQTVDYVALDLPRPVVQASRVVEPDAPVPRGHGRKSSGVVVQALGADRHRIVATREDGSVYGGSLIDDIVELRALRAHRLRGDSPSPGQLERLEALRQRLVTPDTGFPTRRSFERFSCHFPAKLRFASGHEIPIAVLDLGVDGAKVRVYQHALGHGEIVWLAMHLVTRGRPQTVVFTGRVEWTCADHIGLSFSGAPGWEQQGYVRARADTPRMTTAKLTPRKRPGSGSVPIGRVVPRPRVTS
ncbi:MAG: FHA domain-containing protein [Myxococcales bacterium]|nr:FHA domain-containing protein [Myxococcales bacterium]MCB9715688.1 FHA domain-containing protein [Myxococcales bacterium]